LENLSIPIYPSLTSSERERVIDVVGASTGLRFVFLADPDLLELGDGQLASRIRERAERPVGDVMQPIKVTLIANDDNATDILLVEGTQADDTILLSEVERALVGVADVLTSGPLDQPATFSITVDEGVPVAVTVPAGATTIDQLADDIDGALVAAGLDTQLAAARFGNRAPFSCPCIRVRGVAFL